MSSSGDSRRDEYESLSNGTKFVEMRFKNKINLSLGLKIFKSVALASIFLVMGLSSPLLGASYVHLEKMFGVDPQSVSMSMVISSAGYLTGAVICGFIYDKIMPEISFTLVNWMGVIFAIVACHAQDFNIFILAMYVHEVAFGFDDAAGQSYCISIWNGHRLQKPLLQGLHGIWSLGGIFGPMIIKLFLCELDPKDTNPATLIPNIQNNTSRNYKDDITTSRNGDCIDGNIETTRYAFMASGIIAFLANFPFAILCLKGLLEKFRSRRLAHNDQPDVRETNTDANLMEKTPSVEIRGGMSDNPNQVPRSFMFTAVHVVFIFIFTMLNLYSEFLPILFLVSFALKHLGWSVMNSNLLLSVYFGAHFAGRLVGVVSSMWLTPVKMLGINLVLTAAAHLLMLTVNLWPSIIWICVLIAGFGVSTIFPTNVLWISETTPMTGKIGAVMIIGMCSSTMTSPYIAATLTTNLDQMWFVYILVIASLAHILVFVAESIFIKMSK